MLYGGEAWRPLVHIKDVAQAHIECIEADADKVRGEVFNVVQENYQILDLAHKTRHALEDLGIPVKLDIDRTSLDKRSYQISNRKMAEVLGFVPGVTIEEGVKEIVTVLKSGHYLDFDHPIYYNLPWMKLLVGIEERIKKTGKVL